MVVEKIANNVFMITNVDYRSSNVLALKMLDGTGGNEIHNRMGVETWSSDLTKTLQLTKLKALIADADKGYKKNDLKQRLHKSQVVTATNTFPIDAGKSFNFSGEQVEVFCPGQGADKSS